jgi:hypothetical protein
MRKQLVLSMDEGIIQKLKQLKQDSGTPISRILEKSFERSEFYAEQKN